MYARAHHCAICGGEAERQRWRGQLVDLPGGPILILEALRTCRRGRDSLADCCAGFVRHWRRVDPLRGLQPPARGCCARNLYCADRAAATNSLGCASAVKFSGLGMPARQPFRSAVGDRKRRAPARPLGWYIEGSWRHVSD